MRNSLIIMFLFFCTIALAQRQHTDGRVYSGSIGIKDVLVVNQNAQTETRTDSLGNFSIKAQMGDLLIISDYKIENRKIRFTADLISNGLVLIEVKMAATELEEVVINRADISVEKLGIPAGKKYTPAERRLKTAGDFKPIHLLGLLAGSLQVDPILNAINGKTKRLKKEINVERRELLVSKMREWYAEDQIAANYSIPPDYAGGFMYYAVEDVAFAQALAGTDRQQADRELAPVAADYLEILMNEK